MLNREHKIVMCGCLEAGWYVIEHLINNGIKFDYFVTLTPQQASEFNVSGYKDFSDLAEQHHIPVYYPETYSLKSEKDKAFFKENRFGLLVQGGWQRLFPADILDTLEIGAIGGHGSADYLPKGRGRSPLNWSLIEGKRRFIMHLFFIRPGADDGDVFDTEMFDINEFDTIRTLYMKNAMVTKRMLSRSIPKILDGSIAVQPQTGPPSYYPKRSPEDGLIDWEEMDVWQIYNFVRAQTKPYPGAFGFINGEKYTIWRCQVFDTRIAYPNTKYGEVVEVFDSDIIINCRGGLLLINEFEKV